MSEFKYTEIRITQQRISASADPIPPDVQEAVSRFITTHLDTYFQREYERLIFGRPVTGVDIIDGQARPVRAVPLLPEGRPEP